MMHKRNLIEDNKRGENQSFLYFLHEEKKFDVKALDDLCHYIIELDTISLEELRDIHYIENQILRHLVYHFEKPISVSPESKGSPITTNTTLEKDGKTYIIDENGVATEKKD